MIRIPKSAVRLVPSAISVIVTAALIAMLGRRHYGEISVLLATGSLLNSILFHCSRNLIVFRTLLGLAESELSDSWVAAIVVSPLVLAMMAIFGHFQIVSALLVYSYLIGQSLFEREIEYLRSSMDLRGFLLVACAKPAWSLVGIGLIWSMRGASWLPLVAFLVVSVSPILACLPKWKDIKSRLLLQRIASLRSVARVVPLGLVITLSISYIFVSDALIKLTLNQVVSKSVFGLYASCVDLIMPACWVLMGAFAWDFVPRILSTERAYQKDIIVSLCRPLAIVLGTMFVAMLIVPDVKLLDISLNLRTYSALAMANLSAAVLSCLVFPALIAIGHKYAALSISAFGMTLNLASLWWSAKSDPETSLSVGTIAYLIVASHLIALILSGFILYALSIRLRGGVLSARTTKSIN